MSELEWAPKLTPYETTDVNKTILQIATSLIPYFALMAFMFFFFLQGYPYWVVLALSPLASLFLARIFIILHDCSHKSYFKGSPAGCFLLGHFCGVLTFTSLFDFRQSHVIHHANVANLDRRGIGDIWTMTVEEYRSARPQIRFLYRLFRNPWFLFGIAPVIKFVLLNRFPKGIARRKELWSIIFTDIAIALIVFAASATVGIGAYVAVQLPVIFIVSSIGVWVFYINHQFEDVYWSHSENYDRFKAAMKGSSFYKLPGFLEWFTGNIGYHHIHHLNFRIPNYNLKQCYNEVAQVREIAPITLWDGFRCGSLALWDEKRGKLVSFQHSFAPAD